MSATSALGPGPKAITNPIAPNSGASNNPNASSGKRGGSNTMKRILDSAAGRHAQENINTETLLATGMVAIFALMLLPIPTVVLDLMLTFSLSISLVIFLFALHIDRPLDFSAFPSILLVVTLLRLGLNIASTRVILTSGGEGAGSAGQVIEAFGQFIIGGNYIVGIIIFIILVTINFVVITKGSGRIAEVGARFTLDAMPGKQMAIDADLQSGLITEDEAKLKRKDLAREADFYGTMDGASKFVRGDAIAGLIITGINVMAGFVVGMLQHDLSALESAETYTRLTVGDGLVTQIPALLVSIAAGLISTQASDGHRLSTEMAEQVFGARKPMAIASGVLFGMALVPGMPHLAFLILAGALGLNAYKKPKDKSLDFSTDSDVSGDADLNKGEQERIDLESNLSLDLLEIEVGYELVELVDQSRDGSLLKRISGIRKQISEELGILVPPIHMRDNLRLRPGEYRLMLSGSELGRGELRVNRLMVMNGGPSGFEIDGEDCLEPAFGLPARWIGRNQRERAELNGYTVVDPATVAATHIGELLLGHAQDLLGRRELQELLEIHSRENEKVIEELLPNQLSHAQLLRVLRNLLKERVSIRDFRTILEGLADQAPETKDTEALTELVRQRMSKYLTSRHRTEDNSIYALVLAPHIENVFRAMQNPVAGDAFDPSELQNVLRAFEEATKSVRHAEEIPIILTTADIRRAVSTFAARHVPGLQVSSYLEIDSKTNIKTVGVVGGERVGNVMQGVV
ncbi:MAG: flagellar biosynthesis protein FlhA [Myxococcota bacterium]|nr:flagellar biosynthesis protein FlhA [Myxococcota bacterium]